MENDKVKILIISAKRQLEKRIKKMMGDKAALEWTSDIGMLIPLFREETYDVVVLTSSIVKENKADTIDILNTLTGKCPVTQILLLTEPEDMDVAMSALLVGTYHYARLPMSDVELELLISTAIKDKPEFGANLLLDKSEDQNGFENLIGRSAPMRKIYEQIRRAAATDIHILLLGETGTGKDLVAGTIHRLSARSEGPYIPVNLGSLPMELVSSELFGHEKGSFTGAIDRRIGVFEQGNNGTVFLDEIDTVEEMVKVSLLRLIEQKKFTRIGGRQLIESDARIIAASNANLEEMIKKGEFRKDLFYRLDTFRISLPPLRERHGDIPILAENFVARYSQSFEKSITRVSDGFVRRLEAYDWPGNIRELRNVIQKAVLTCEEKELKSKHLPPNIGNGEKLKPVIKFEIGTPLDEIEKEMLIQALSIAKDNRSRAAELLGISRRAIYNKLNKYNLS
jgi:DNA-binding NtrC family response regulator